MESIESRASKWLLSGDTGASSKALCGWMLHGKKPSHHDHPSDGGDLGRCLRLLEAIPEWKPRIGEMVKHGPYWAALAARWDELTASLAEEYGPKFMPKDHFTGSPKTYKLMKLILDPIIDADPKTIRFGAGCLVRF